MGKNNAKAWLSLAMIFALCLCIGGESIAATLRVGSSGEDVKTLGLLHGQHRRRVRRGHEEGGYSLPEEKRPYAGRHSGRGNAEGAGDERV